MTSIPMARLASNLPAASRMVFAALNFSRRTPEQAGFNAAMLLLSLSLPQSVETFGNDRSSFWQITALATLTLVARHVALTEVDLDTRRSRRRRGPGNGGLGGVSREMTVPIRANPNASVRPMWSPTTDSGFDT